MSSIRFGATHEFQLLRREEVRTRWTLETALDFLKRFRNDTVALAGFRRLVPSKGRGITAAANDQQLFQSIAKMMVSGELLLVKPQGLIDHGHLSLKVTAAPVAEAPPTERAEPTIVEVTNTFESDHDGVSQAVALRAAAANGAPFCAECARYAAEQSAIVRPAAKPPAPAPPPPAPEPAPLTFKKDANAARQAATLIAAAEEGIPFCEECNRLAEEKAHSDAASVPAPPPPAPPPPAPPPPAPVEAPEPLTFAKNEAAQKQAATLVTAAAQGLPFCEECNKQNAKSE